MRLGFGTVGGGGATGDSSPPKLVFQYWNSLEITRTHHLSLYKLLVESILCDQLVVLAHLFHTTLIDDHDLKFQFKSL